MVYATSKSSSNVELKYSTIQLWCNFPIKKYSCELKHLRHIDNLSSVSDDHFLLHHSQLNIGILYIPIKIIKITAGRIKKKPRTVFTEIVMSSKVKRGGTKYFLLLCCYYLSRSSYSILPTNYPQLIPNHPPGSLHIHQLEQQWHMSF